jgi:hypothetical protein
VSPFLRHIQGELFDLTLVEETTHVHPPRA